MLLPIHLHTILKDGEIKKEVNNLKLRFAKQHCRYTEISDEDFLGLVFITPNIGVALADKEMSFKEEMDLNRKARKLSKGGFYLKKDPIVHYMNRFVLAFDEWEDEYLKTLKFILEKLFTVEELNASFTGGVSSEGKVKLTLEEFHAELLQMSYIFIKILESMFFSMNYEELIKPKSYNKVEYDKVIEIGDKIGMKEVNIFQSFLHQVVIKNN